MPFTERLPSGLIGGVPQRWLSFWEVLASPQRNSGALELADQGPSPIAQFGWAASSRKGLGGSKLLPFKNGGHCVLGDLQCCRHFLVRFPISVPRHNTVSELYGLFL